MPDNFIRHIIQVIIESFSTDEVKKEDMLRNIMDQKKAEEDQ